MAMLLIAILVILSHCVIPPSEAPAEEYKLAAILPGVITDADYNMLGYIGITAVQTDLGIDVAYSESVAVPDVEQVVREYIDDGYNIIFTHGGQFANQTKNLANQFPDAFFIGECDTPIQDAPDNMWVIDRNFHTGFYAIGALAAKQTQTGKIGYLGGLTLPFSYAEVHAMQQAITDLRLDVELNPVWVGDFNDPSRAREFTGALIMEGADVIVGSLNLGMFGLFEAVKEAPDQVWATAKYTDKSSYAPDNYVTSLLCDWARPLKEIVKNIMYGVTSGYYPLTFGAGFDIQFPLKNVTEELNIEIERIVSDIQSGETEVILDIEVIEY